MPSTKEENAASLIQRNWLEFKRQKKWVPTHLKHKVRDMGRLLEGYPDAEQCIKQCKIIVHVNIVLFEPYNGHSCFFINDFHRSHLRIYPVSINENERPEFYSKYAILKKRIRGLSFDDPPEGFENRAVITINKPLPADHDVQRRIAGMCRDKYLFVLEDKYTRFFAEAFENECLFFKTFPYSYGDFYNCHIFVLNVLKRIKRMHDSTPDLRPAYIHP